MQKNLIIIVFFMSYICLFSLDDNSKTGSKLSLGGGIVYTFHNASFYSLYPCQTCTQFDNVLFTSSNGSGVFLTSLFSYRINEILRAELGIDFMNNTIDFQQKKFWTYTTEMEKLYINYQMKPTLNFFTINLGPSIVLLENLNVGIYINMNYILTANTYYSESIESEKQNDVKYLFSNDKNLFAEQNVDLLNINKINISFSPLISYDWAINDLLMLSPKFSYTMGLSELQKGTNWKMSTLSFSLNLTVKLTDYKTDNNIELPDCPEGMRRDNFGNCVPIECPPGYRLIGNDCKKINENIALTTKSKDCPPNYYFSEKYQNCEPILPPIDKNCKGIYIAILCNFEGQAYMLEKELRNRGFDNLWIESATDQIDIRKKIWRIRTSCYPSTPDAINARKAIHKILSDIKDQEFEGVTVETIKDY